MHACEGEAGRRSLSRGESVEARHDGTGSGACVSLSCVAPLLSPHSGGPQAGSPAAVRPSSPCGRACPQVRRQTMQSGKGKESRVALAGRGSQRRQIHERRVYAGAHLNRGTKASSWPCPSRTSSPILFIPAILPSQSSVQAALTEIHTISTIFTGAVAEQLPLVPVLEKATISLKLTLEKDLGEQKLSGSLIVRFSIRLTGPRGARRLREPLLCLTKAPGPAARRLRTEKCRNLLELLGEGSILRRGGDIPLPGAQASPGLRRPSQPNAGRCPARRGRVVSPSFVHRPGRAAREVRPEPT